MSAKKSITSPPDAELSALRAKVARRREYLDLLEVELANTRAALLEFTQLYNTRIGPLESLEKRLQQWLEQLTADQAPPDKEWHGRTQAKRNANGNSQDYSSKPQTEKKSAASNDPDYERKVRDLFRKLAKQYHPDTAGDEKDKKLLQRIMAEINQAYSSRDLAALETLAKRNGHVVSGARSSPAAELERLKTELHQLESMIFEIEHNIRELDLSPAMQMRSELKADQCDGRDALGELEAEFKERIAILQEQLLALGADLDSIRSGTN